MHPFHHAAATPEKPAYIMAATGEAVSYAALEARSNQIAHALRGLGLQRGDAIALLAENSAWYFPICWAAQRAGLYFTCISTKLMASEVAYILNDCGAKALFASPNLAAAAAEAAAQTPGLVARIAVGGDVEGFQPLAEVLAGQPETPVADQSQGRDMLYSSGTTGRPKGVRVALADTPIDAIDPLTMLVKMLYDFGPDSRYLSPAPLYHAAPLRYSMAVQKMGGTVIVMDHFEPERALEAIETYQATHSQWVPTMFVRMLKLPEAARARHNVSSLRFAIHAAAPCPVEVKQQMIDWWGPVIYEYYSATEGAGFTAISPQEWLSHRGSVGKSILGTIRIIDEEGEVLPPGAIGRVFFEGGPKFEYHNAPEKTQDSYNAQGWATFGDIGYVDAEGYLYLTDRQAFMIISGGVNVYPQEVENVLIGHPKVADVAVFGVPDPDLGEAVKAVVQPLSWTDATPELAAELIGYCRARLSHIKCPKTVDFEAELPRHATGKLYKRLLKDRYWS
jgi:long-chain acyl-CoA synthetase